MSGYLFLVAANGANYSLNQQAKAKKSKQRSEDSRSISTGDSGSIRTSISSSRGSIHSSRKTNSKPRTKKKFDMNTSTYVTVVESPYERRLQKYEQKYHKLMTECSYHQQNQYMSKFRTPDGQLLFTEDNLNVLRYTFFKELTGDYDKIYADMTTKKNGQYKLKYMRRLSELKQRQKTGIRGLPSFSSDNLLDDKSVDTVDESEDLEESDDDTPQGPYHQDTFSYKPNLMINLKPTINVKDLIRSNQFWNNVYQDLKFNLMELSRNFNYFDLLPNLNQLLTFYKETIEYFLMNIDCLSCNLNDLSGEEYDDLSTCTFHYLKDFGYEWFRIMSNAHFKLFNDQAALNSNINMFHDTNFSIHKQLINKIIETVMENLRNSVPASKKLDEVFGLWEQFVNYIISEMIVKNYNFDNLNDLTATDHLPEPNLDGASSLKSFNSTSNTSLNPSFTTYAPSFEDPIHSKPHHDTHGTRNQGNLSINTKPNLSPISRIDEENTTDDIEFNYKRGGFVIEPPTPSFPEHDLMSPSSATFSTFSDSDTKSYSSKKSIFSKFRKNKR